MNVKQERTVNQEQIRAMVVEFVRGVDGVTGQVPATASFEELGVDSMSTIDLLIKVEHEFGVEVPDEQLPMIVNIQDLVDFVASAKQEVIR
jgi:acyl carrier protein